MKISILTFEGFNEIDSLVAFRMPTLLRKDGWEVKICFPTPQVTSIGGLTISAQESLEEASKADAVMIGSGSLTREISQDDSVMSRIRLDPHHQLIEAQCSGTLMLSKLGFLQDISACTDLATKPWVQEAGVKVLNQPLFSKNTIATAGGCLASAYLTAWVVAKLSNLDKATEILHYFAPVGEKDSFVQRAFKNISPYLSL